MDRDDIPHYTGAVASLMKEYIRRVTFAFGGLEGEGKDAEAEAADLLKKQCRFGRRLIDALHGEAWRAVAHLVMQPEKLRKKDGFEEVLAALGSTEKEGVIRKTEAFVKFFEPTGGNKGEAIDAYLRRKNQAWQDLRDLDEASAMAILLANKSPTSMSERSQTPWRDDRSRKHFQTRRQDANEAYAESEQDEEAYFQETWSEDEIEGEPEKEEA